ncbi:hypothetical protein P175DRAFT_0560038 [Aspergillus ochraceoroseus IBT 24754]|uniref:Uncharacterized protein n=1 Tax=Aspergillus ochraceoroseus IBT 24754 TaxID=1392256 RepID=A0A2T5LPC6_9EURO|nr:uncharacterized protein P175DRAFT_0560038 [Aspergillus ochraceoroseus IBT 24754]PTU18139.1 hypothetical protein P175DRAFT_0560038 [Aspergillus ochraceoroseus IBT 24754]
MLDSVTVTITTKQRLSDTEYLGHHFAPDLHASFKHLLSIQFREDPVFQGQKAIPLPIAAAFLAEYLDSPGLACLDAPFETFRPNMPLISPSSGATGAQGALMVFQNPDFQRLNVWEPSSNEWTVIITY